ncbi:fasciclin domain-containing protein [Salinimicrobium sp. TH3]|uniref:fasciclin domain-containing protein n=1 Tax=Salinimicrobium sp. TH3 TaxID=2997342 RepID=UPI0022731CAF|nr:fasciclin domain-containing protein [Salinimicrobium sp. TH3]MCY2687615.1 fasciclin domain-containing protein [Salinimicrobium sp. TH3]
MKNVLNYSNVLKSFLVAGLFVMTSCEKEPALGEVSALNATEEATAAANAKASPAAIKGDKTIAEIVVSYATAEAVEDRQFTLLLAALEYAGITSMFTESDQYTVFAPTDAAFERFLDGNALDSFTKEQVAAVLSYHVTDGRRFSNSVVPKNSPRNIETLLGPSIYVNSSAGIDTNDEDKQANASILVEAGLFDISASNGVIHVIDEVLVPVTE